MARPEGKRVLIISAKGETVARQMSGSITHRHGFVYILLFSVILSILFCSVLFYSIIFCSLLFYSKYHTNDR